MSDLTAALGDGRIRISDPKPAFCSACLQGAQENVRFMDFGAAFDAGAFQNRETLAYVEGSDDLHLCFACLKTACEVAGLKPELHAQQLKKIRGLELENEHWRDYARRQEETLQTRPEPAPNALGRKVAV